METTLSSVTVQGRRFSVETAGLGKDVVLFIHGSGFTGAMWAPFARSLESRCRSVMVDLLGHGRSEPIGNDELVDGRFDLAMLEDVARRESLSSASGRIHVVGHSYGAVLAARLALAQPGLVRSLVLVEPVMFGPLLEERPIDCVRELHALYGDGSVLDPAVGGTEAWTARFYDYWTGQGAWALLTPRQRELQLQVARKSFCEVRDASLDRRPFAEYSALPKPLLLVGGGRSKQCAQRILERLGEVTGAIVHVVPSATHFLPITHGPELIELLVRLWAIPEESVAKEYVGDM